MHRMQPDDDKGRRRREVIRDALDEHAEILIHTGHDRVEDIEADHPELVPAVDSLLRVTHEVYGAMTPVEPSSRFVNTLRMQLSEHQAEVSERWAQEREHARKITSMLSSAVLALAVIALLATVVGAVAAVMRVLTVSSRRQRPFAA